MKTQAILFIFLFPIILLGQSRQTDTPLPIVEEGEKLLALNLPDSALVYAQSILNRPKLDLLSKNQALLVSGRALFNNNNIDASIYPLQTSLSISRKLKNKSLTLLTLIALAGTKIVSENPSLDSAQILLEIARPMAEASNDTRSMGRIYNGLAIISTDKLDYSKASEFCSLCESILKNSNFKREKAFCYNTTGNYFDELYKKNGNEDDLRTALGYYQKAADIFQEIGDKRLEANIRLNLGSAAGFLDDYAKAEMEVKHAMKLGEELKDSTILLDGYYALANNYEGENRIEEAKLSLNNMIALLKKTGTAAEIAFVKDQFSNQDIEVSTAFVKNRVDLLDKQIEIAKSAREKQILWFVSVVSG